MVMERRAKQKTTVVVALLLLLLIGVVAAGGRLMRHAGAASAAQKKLQGERAERAKGLYTDNCARCHGADGRGQTPMGRVFNAPNLADPGWWKKERPTDRRLTNSIRHGRNEERMPAFGRQLSKSDITALVRLVRAFNDR